MLEIAVTTALTRAAQRLSARVDELGKQLDAGEERWSEYAMVAAALATIAPQLAPGVRGELLTTAEMATRLHLSPKTLLKRARRGELKPALRRGRLIRWHADQTGAR